MVEGFPLAAYQPYRPRWLLPADLLKMSHIAFFVADLLRAPSGACISGPAGIMCWWRPDPSNALPGQPVTRAHRTAPARTSSSRPIGPGASKRCGTTPGPASDDRAT